MEALTIQISPEAIEAIAQRAAEIVATSDEGHRKWLSVAEAAEYLGRSTSSIYSLVSARRIPHEKDGSRVVFKASVLDEWVGDGGGKCPA